MTVVPTLLLALAAALLGAPAAADDGSTGSTDGPPGGVTVDGRLVLVLDSSGSMKEPATGGVTKVEAARQALTDVVANLPDDAEVGMRVFGATVFSRRDKGACADTQNVVPVGPLDRGELAARIHEYQPYGETPIGAALEGAASDLGSTGKRAIVLLSDGEPTCAPDPCKVARRLRRGGVDLTINVVGLDVDAKARRALQCVAAAGGGAYYDVDSPEELAGSLVSVSVRALRTFAVRGTPVRGGTTDREPLRLEPGQYTDHLRPGQAARYYVVEKRPGWGLDVSATARPEPSEDVLDNLTVTLSTPDGHRCGSASASRANVLAERAILSAGVGYLPQVTPYTEEECAPAGRLVVAVSTQHDAVDKHYELRVTPQPPVKGLTGLPGPVEEPDRWARPAHATGTPTPVLGGAGFDDAPRLGPGAYTDTLRPGEQLVYRVRADWGQAPRVTVTVRPDLRADALLDAVGDTVGIAAFSPVRQELHLLSYGAQRVSDSGRYTGTEPLPLTAPLAPVRLRNAEEGGISLPDQRMAGDYYFTVEMGRLDDDTRFVAPLDIRVELAGQVSGVPELADPAPHAGPDAGAAGGPDAGAAGRDRAAAAPATEGIGTAGIGAGAAAVVLAAVALGWWVRRRRTG